MDVHFSCVYPSTLKISSNIFNIQTVTQGDAEVTQIGNLSKGFSVKLYTDSTFHTKANDNNVFIGQEIYGEVKWSVTSAQANVKFFIDQCDIVSKNVRVSIIYDNCYSQSAGVVQLQSEKIVSSSSKFKFVSFTFGRGNDRAMEAVLTCTVRMCVGDSCADSMTHQDKDCKGSFATAYQYKANTWLLN